MDDLSDLRDQRIADEIKRINEELAAVVSDTTARLPERIFVGVFLPFFAGDENLLYKVDISTWINVARSAFASVDVIDSTGAVIFSVPPLYERDAVQPVTKEGLNSIAHVVASTTQLTNVHPSQGQAYLNNELSKRALVMKVPVNVVKHISVWNEIFKRYGRPPLMLVEPDEQPKAATANNSDSGDFDYQSL